MHTHPLFAAGAMYHSALLRPTLAQSPPLYAEIRVPPSPPPDYHQIMLNTDLHNPNIRTEKRMSCDAFIQNNKNYGGDISGGHDLPRDFLESVYASVKDHPIATFGGGPDAPVTANG